jgi:hypothetical protein
MVLFTQMAIANVKGLAYESSTVEKPVRISDLILNFSPQFVDMPACVRKYRFYRF